jgi:hypothetical protein
MIRLYCASHANFEGERVAADASVSSGAGDALVL